MKRLIIAICILVCALSTQAQNQIFTKYATMDGIEFVCINKALFDLGSAFIKSTTGDDSLGKLSNIEKLFVISAESEKGKKQIDKDISSLSTDDDYEILMTSHSESGDNVFIFSNRRKPHELIIGTIEKQNSSMVVVVGNFTKEEVAKLMQ